MSRLLKQPETIDRVAALPPSNPDVTGATWPAAAGYLRRGLAIVRRQPWLYVQITIVFSLPALFAAWLAIESADRPVTIFDHLALAGLPWITAVIAPVVTMVAVGYHAHGHSVSLGYCVREALPWVPRYVWTNAHTSLIFWIPVGLLLEARELLAHSFVPPEPLGSIVLALVWLLIGIVAVTIHARTLLAPFLAVHSDLPGTIAVLEAWRLSGRHFGLCLATFLVASLPIAVPLALIAVIGYALAPGSDRAAWIVAAPSLALVGIQILRPILIPAVYRLQHDLWPAELARRANTGAPPIPPPLQLLLGVTRPLPKFGRPIGADPAPAR